MSLATHEEAMDVLYASGHKAQRPAVHRTLKALFGRVLAGDLRAPFDLPQRDNAAVDGFAFNYDRARRATFRLPVVGDLRAGDEAIGADAGAAMRIATGAPLPTELDTIAMHEQCDLVPGFVRLPDDLRRGDNCRRAGEDVKRGAGVLRAGQRLGAPEIATLAALGMSGAKVHRKVRVALMTSGDEVTSPGDSLSGEGQTYDAYTHALIAATGRLPARCVFTIHAADRFSAFLNAFRRACQRADLLVVCAGAAGGPSDFAYEALRREGEVFIRGVRIKPGRPLTIGRAGDALTLCLPGNPVASILCFALYARAAILALSGAGRKEIDLCDGAALPLRLAVSKRKKADRREFWRASVTPKSLALPYPTDGSGIISSLRETSGILVAHEALEEVPAGASLPFIPYAAMGLR